MTYHLIRCKRLNQKYTDPLFDLDREDALAFLGSDAGHILRNTSVRRIGVSLVAEQLLAARWTADTSVTENL